MPGTSRSPTVKIELCLQGVPQQFVDHLIITKWTDLATKYATRCGKILTNGFAVVVVQESQPGSDNIECSDVQGYPIKQPFVGIQQLTEVAQSLDILVSYEGDEPLEDRFRTITTGRRDSH